MNRIAQYRVFFARLWRISRGDHGALGLLIVLVFLAAVTEGIGVAMIVPIVDAITSQSNFDRVPLIGFVVRAIAALDPAWRLPVASLALFGLIALRSVLQYAANVMNQTVPLRIERRLRLGAYDRLVAAQYDYVAGRSAGELANVVLAHPPRVTIVYVSVCQMISAVLLVGIYGILMFALSPGLTLVAIAFLGAVTLVLRRISSGPLARVGVDASVATERQAQVFHNTISAFKLMRVSAAESTLAGRVRAAVAMLQSAQIRAAAWSAVPPAVLTLAVGGVVCGALFVASFDERPGATVSQTVVFLFLMSRLLAPVSLFNSAWSACRPHLDAFEALERFEAEAGARAERGGTSVFGGFQEAIDIKGLEFAYSSDKPGVLRGIDLRVPRGKMVALVGASGAGKSTLVNLLLRLYEPPPGTVLVDGRDVRDFDLVSWRRKVRAVTQDVTLLNDTVEANLTLALPEDRATPERIAVALRRAGCAEFVDELPSGVRTVLGERGLRLSGGQQQRLALARALLAEPELLILDEATSQLDTLTERAIADAVEALRGECTLVLIAHRLATVVRADAIAVLDRGRIVQLGRHDELVRQPGLYRRLVESQELRPEEPSQSAAAGGIAS
ncbi:MAG: ABC transporter ATP-binding protein [Azospirillum sp.]|nr:ABC transporter ATP-binding protein [Azospirillum sp.]